MFETTGHLWLLLLQSERGGGLSGDVGSHWEVTSGHPKLSKTLSGVCANAVL